MDFSLWTLYIVPGYERVSGWCDGSSTPHNPSQVLMLFKIRWMDEGTDGFCMILPSPRVTVCLTVLISYSFQVKCGETKQRKAVVNRQQIINGMNTRQTKQI